jgi:membrane-associated protease RseP (regulator of RpoE activity)
MTQVVVAHTDEAPQSRRTTTLRLVGLALGTAAMTAFIYALGGWAAVIVIYAVIAIIMLHEFGHYVTARLSGMKATEFFVGFGPKLWSIRKGETEYGVKAFPLGGYVRILGMTSMEEVADDDEPRSFINQSTRSRVLVASAGSIVHVLLALVLAFCALFFYGESAVTNTVQIASLVHEGAAKSPAQLAGLRVGDDIVSIDGHATTLANVASQISGHGSHPLTIVVRRASRVLTLTATPRVESAKGPPVLGIYIENSIATKHLGFSSSVANAGSVTWQVTTGTLAAFEHAFSPRGLLGLFHAVTNTKAGKAAAQSATTPKSIIGFLEYAIDAARKGVQPLMAILISLNISLAILNMIPMLPLDGGHVAIALYERARTRRGRAKYHADVSKLLPYAYAFMAFLLIFVVSKAYLDVAHGVSNPFG